MIKLKHILKEADFKILDKPKKSTPIVYRKKTYYIPADFDKYKQVFAYEDPEMRKPAKHPKGGVLLIKKDDIQYFLKK